ncbi:MAG: hypothetical protein WD738_11605 [Pirellulales bacterium]
MNAFRKFRLVILFGLVAALALGVSVATAEAGGHHTFYKFHNVHSSYPSHCNYGHYYPTLYQPMVNYVVKPYSYPVTLVDCYGQPYVVWQTSYQSVPTSYYP